MSSTTPHTPALHLQHVRKEFTTAKGDQFIALNDVSLTVEPGQIYGLLGPNGAGKSTMISLITGTGLPTSGSVQVFGHDVVAHPHTTKPLVGVVPQDLVTEMAFTVEEVLYYFSGMYGVPAAERDARITQVLADLELTDKRHERARKLSGGMQRRLMVAKAVMHRPKLLILDEPTAGVDVALRQRLWALVRRLRDEGTTILFTTHYLEEAEELCDRIAVMNKGNIIREGTLASLRKEFHSTAVIFELDNPDAMPHLPGVRLRSGAEYEYVPEGTLQDGIRDVCSHYGAHIASLRSDRASLEKIFLSLTSA